MKVRFDKRFWVIITCIIVVFTVFIVGRNLIHALAIRSDIRHLEQQKRLPYATGRGDRLRDGVVLRLRNKGSSEFQQKSGTVRFLFIISSA